MPCYKVSLILKAVIVRPVKLKKALVMEEDASRLHLGAEFQQSHCLFNTEVYLLLSQIQEDRIATYGPNSLPPYGSSFLISFASTVLLH